VSWHIFADGASLLRSADPGAGLHLYATHPQPQIGPLTFLAATPLNGLPPWLSGSVAAVAIAATDPAMLLSLSHLPGLTMTHRQRGLAAAVLMPVWAELAVHYAHLDDALALVLLMVALHAAARSRSIPTALLLAASAGAKPWAVAFVPLLLVLPRDRWHRAIAAWLGTPFQLLSCGQPCPTDIVRCSNRLSDCRGIPQAQEQGCERFSVRTPRFSVSRPTSRRWLRMGEEVTGAAWTRHRWRRRLAWGLAALMFAPILGVGALWPLTPSVDSATDLVRAEATHGSAELAVLPRPDRVAQALLATENSRFYHMPGIDPVSVVRAGLAALTGSNTGGATLEQQLAKNLYFPRDDGIVAKVKEAELALKLDARYSKDEVLRLYLADAYFGQGFYGLPAASEGYFARTPAHLSWAQASMLAGLVQAPSAYDPMRHLSAGRLRQRHVLNRLVDTGVLSAVMADSVFAAASRPAMRHVSGVSRQPDRLATRP